MAWLTTVLVFQPTCAASSHFLARDSTVSVLARDAQKGAEISAAQDSSSSKDAYSLQQLASSAYKVVEGVKRAPASWLYEVPGPDGRPQAINMPETSPLSVKEFYVETLLSWLSWLIVALLAYLCLYRGCVPVPEKNVEVQADIQTKLEKMFNSGHFSCFEDSTICMCSFFCPALRWSDTASLAGFLGFWAAFAAFSAAMLVNGFINGAMFGVITAFLLLYFRQQLRQQLHVPSWTVGSCCLDFFYVCCCPCCAIAQEARIVKEGIENGYAFSSP